MFEKIKRFVRWVNEEVHLGKLWGLTLLVFGIFVALAFVFQGWPPGSLVDVTLSTLLIIFYPFFLTALWVTLTRLDRLPWFQNWSTGLMVFGLLGWFCYSIVVHPAETLAFFSNELSRMWADPVIYWMLTIFGWIIAGCFMLVIGSAIAALIVRRIRKNR